VLLGYLLVKGVPSLGRELIFGQVDVLDAVLLRKRVFDGLFPAIAGTLSVVLLSVGLAVPVGLCAGIYMSEFATVLQQRVFGLMFDILAGIPSIVIGLFGFSGAIFIHKYVSNDFRPCLAVSVVALAFLVLPYITRTTQASMQGLSVQTRQAALALGATRVQNIFYVLLPQSFSGILSGIILAIGRCAEDTAVIMLTGVVATAGIPGSLLSSYEALPFYIYYISSQYTDATELMSGYGAAIILLGVCAVLFFLAFLIKRRLAGPAGPAPGRFHG
jgi:phosphate transport system permease protein